MAHYVDMEMPNESGETKRQVLTHVMRETNGEVVPPELSINISCPYEFRFVVDTYFKLSKHRQDLTPIDPTIVHNYLSMRGQRMSAFEHDALIAIDSAFITAMHNKG